jgi:hypothetical protein
LIIFLFGIVILFKVRYVKWILWFDHKTNNAMMHITELAISPTLCNMLNKPIASYTVGKRLCRATSPGLPRGRTYARAVRKTHISIVLLSYFKIVRHSK